MDEGPTGFWATQQWRIKNSIFLYLFWIYFLLLCLLFVWNPESANSQEMLQTITPHRGNRSQLLDFANSNVSLSSGLTIQAVESPSLWPNWKPLLVHGDLLNRTLLVMKVPRSQTGHGINLQNRSVHEQSSAANLKLDADFRKETPGYTIPWSHAVADPDSCQIECSQNKMKYLIPRSVWYTIKITKITESRNHSPEPPPKIICRKSPTLRTSSESPTWTNCHAFTGYQKSPPNFTRFKILVFGHLLEQISVFPPHVGTH